MTQRSIVEKFKASYDEYTVLAEQLNVAWGDTGDGKSAKPRALQLEIRLEYGKLLLADRERSAGSKKVLKQRLLALQRELKLARRDSKDVARCFEFQALQERHDEKLAEVAALYDQAREVLGDDRIRAIMAGDRGHARPEAKGQAETQTTLFFMGAAG